MEPQLNRHRLRRHHYHIILIQVPLKYYLCRIKNHVTVHWKEKNIIWVHKKLYSKKQNKNKIKQTIYFNEKKKQFTLLNKQSNVRFTP